MYIRKSYIYMKLYRGSGGAITICVNGVLLNGSLTIYPLCTILNVMWCMALDFEPRSLARRNMKKQHTRIIHTLKRKHGTIHNDATILFLCTHTSYFIWSLSVCVSCRVACVAQTCSMNIIKANLAVRVYSAVREQRYEHIRLTSYPTYVHARRTPVLWRMLQRDEEKEP